MPANMPANMPTNVTGLCEVLSICEGYGLVCDHGITRLIHYGDGRSITMEGEWKCICRSCFSYSPTHEFSPNPSGNVIVCGDSIRIYSDRHENEIYSPSHLQLLYQFPISIPYSTKHFKHHSKNHQSTFNSNSNICVCVWSNSTCTELICGLRNGHLLLISSELSDDSHSLSSPPTRSIWKFRHCVRCVQGSQSIRWKGNEFDNIDNINTNNSSTPIAGICACDVEGHVMIGVRLSDTRWTCFEIHGICAKSVWCNDEEILCVCEDGVWLVNWCGDILRCVYNHSFENSFICGNDNVLILVEENGLVHWCSRY